MHKERKRKNEKWASLGTNFSSSHKPTMTIKKRNTTRENKGRNKRMIREWWHFPNIFSARSLCLRKWTKISTKLHRSELRTVIGKNNTNRQQREKTPGRSLKVTLINKTRTIFSDRRLLKNKAYWKKNTWRKNKNLSFQRKIINRSIFFIFLIHYFI